MHFFLLDLVTKSLHTYSSLILGDANTVAISSAEVGKLLAIC